MLYGILEELHRAVPLVRDDQRVDDLARCAVGHQTAVVKQMVEAAEIIILACDRLSLVISPVSTIRCSDVNTETLLRRVLLESGIHFGADTGGGARRAVCVVRKRLCEAAKRSKRLASSDVTPKKRPASTAPTSGHAPALVVREWALVW